MSTTTTTTDVRIRRLSAALGRRLHQDDPEGGFSVPELVMLVPLFVIILLIVVAAGRVQDAGVRITGAARDGARAASLERTAAAAGGAARQVVAANLTGQQIGCAGGPAVSVDATAFGAGGRVQVTVVCRVDLRDVAVPGLPGSARLSKSASSPVETYRGTS